MDEAHAQVDQRWQPRWGRMRRVVRIRYIGGAFVTVEPVNSRGLIRTMTLAHLYKKYELVAE